MNRENKRRKSRLELVAKAFDTAPAHVKALLHQEAPGLHFTLMVLSSERKAKLL